MKCAERPAHARRRRQSTDPDVLAVVPPRPAEIGDCAAADHRCGDRPASRAVWFTESGQSWVETTFGLTTTAPLQVLSWVLSVAAALGVVAGSVFLMPAVTGLLAGFFADEVAEEVERRYYSGDPPGHALPVAAAMIEGIKTALLAIGIYLVAMPSLLLAGFGAVIFSGHRLPARPGIFRACAMRCSPAEAGRCARPTRARCSSPGCSRRRSCRSDPNLATPLFERRSWSICTNGCQAGVRRLIEGERAG
jgi:hypothetical protein